MRDGERQVTLELVHATLALDLPTEMLDGLEDAFHLEGGGLDVGHLHRTLREPDEAVGLVGAEQEPGHVESDEDGVVEVSRIDVHNLALDEAVAVGRGHLHDGADVENGGRDASSVSGGHGT